MASLRPAPRRGTTHLRRVSDSLAAQPLRERGVEALSALCAGLGLTEEVDRMAVLLEELTSSWGELLTGQQPWWPSDITDDHSPFELSVALGGAVPEVRVLFEAQAAPMTLASGWQSARALSERLHHQFGIPLERYRLVEELFRPEHPRARFSAWHSVGCRPGEPLDFKVYFNPQARGPERAAALVQEALERLGFGEAWRFLARHALRREAQDVFGYFSLDLTNRHDARVKVYIGYLDATADDIERAVDGLPDYRPGDARRFCREMTGAEGPYSSRPPLTCCYAFTRGEGARPSSVTLHVPVRRYVGDDREACERICRFLAPEDRQRYTEGLLAFARRPLEAGPGIQTYASLRQQGGRSRLTLYLSPELYTGPWSQGAHGPEHAASPVRSLR